MPHCWQATKLFAKTMQLGPPWIVYDPLTEALRALYVQQASTVERLFAIFGRAEQPRNHDLDEELIGRCARVCAMGEAMHGTECFSRGRCARGGAMSEAMCGTEGFSRVFSEVWQRHTVWCNEAAGKQAPAIAAPSGEGNGGAGDGAENAGDGAGGGAGGADGATPAAGGKPPKGAKRGAEGAHETGAIENLRVPAPCSITVLGVGG